MTQKTALITGITGQDGAYLAEYLLSKNYHIIGAQQPSATPNTQNIDHLIDHKHFTLLPLDITDANAITRLIKETQPQEIYNLAGQSHVGLSFNLPATTAQVNAIGTLNILESIRLIDPSIKFYQASSSEIFGNHAPAPQNEATAMNPSSPYAAAKLYAYHITKIYRESYGLFACNGILFNHESPIRGENFVTRKITKAVAGIHAGHQKTLKLGNLDARRDWGHAKDYVRGMTMIMHYDQPDDFVLATGESHSVREFVELAFDHIDITIEWRGQGSDEVGVNEATGTMVIEIDPDLYRPNEVHALCGDASKACLLYTSPSPRDRTSARMPSSA